jgi:hypothetical protein
VNVHGMPAGAMEPPWEVVRVEHRFSSAAHPDRMRSGSYGSFHQALEDRCANPNAHIPPMFPSDLTIPGNRGRSYA